MTRFFKILLAVCVLPTCLFSNMVVAEQLVVEQKLKMNLGNRSNSDFEVALVYQPFSPAVSLTSGAQADAGVSYLAELKAANGDQNRLKSLVNRNRENNFSKEDFSFLLPRMAWLAAAQEIEVQGKAQVGQYHFYVLTMILKGKKQSKMLGFKEHRSAMMIPDLADDHYTYMMAAYALNKNLKKGKRMAMSKDMSSAKCIVRNGDECGLYLRAKVTRYSKDKVKSDKVIQFLNNSNSLAKTSAAKIDRYFADSFNQIADPSIEHKQAYLAHLASMKPILSIEFDNSIVSYLGSEEEGKTIIGSMLRLSKSKKGLKIEEPMKFNFIDKAFTDARFFNTLLRN